MDAIQSIGVNVNRPHSKGRKFLWKYYRMTGKGDRPFTDADKVLNLEKQIIMTTYDRVKDKKYYFRYTIVRSDNLGFEINAEEVIISHMFGLPMVFISGIFIKIQKKKTR